MSTRNVYIFSGLGADERVFQYLDLSGYHITFIKWIKPNNESIENYATRLLNQITHPQPVLMGLSFGGLMAIEVAKQIKIEKTILISSAKTRHEIPFYFHAMGFLRFHKFMSLRLMKKPSTLNYWLFGAESDRDRKLLAEVLHDTDIHFLKWAVEKIGAWKNVSIPDNVIHIHGTADRIIPYHFVSCNITIKGGGHFMTVNKAEELTKRIRAIL